MGLGISTGCTQTIPDDINNRIEETGLKETFKDWSAVVVQHEFDHLNGFLIEDRGKAYYANN